MNAAVQQGASWADIGSDCQAVGELDDGKQRLADRLLGRLWPALERELSVYAWAGQSACGRDFLETAILPVGLRKLRSYGLLAADRLEIVRVHDVVFAALDVKPWCSPERARDLDDSLEAYLLLAATEPGLRFWTTARIMRSKLEALLAEGSKRVIFRYALLTFWDTDELRTDLIGDPIADAQALAGAKPEPFAIMAVIEAIEQLFLRDKADGNQIAADRLRARLPAFVMLAALPTLSDREIAQIKHHKGKALKRLGETDAAATLFEEVLTGAAALDESRLQLIDIYRTNPQTVERAVQLVDEILTRSAGSDEVSYSVFLGAVERLPWGGGCWRSALFRKHAAAIETTIVETADQGVQQAYRTFAAIGRYLSTEEPALFHAIFSRLTLPTPESLSTDNDKAAWGEINFEASRLPGSDPVALRERALAFYEAALTPQRFHLQRRAELLIDMERAPEAEAMLTKRDDLETSEWLQRLMARARLQRGEPSDALVWIERALAGLTAEHFRSEFLELRYEIRLALDDAEAIDDLKLALSLSQKANETERMQNRLNDIVTLIR